MTENCIYIKDGHLPGNARPLRFAYMILNGLKLYESRSHNRLIHNKWIGIARGNVVLGRVIFDKPVKAYHGSAPYIHSYIEATEYDIKPGETKYFYKVLAVEKFDTPKPIIRHGNYGLYELDNREGF